MVILKYLLILSKTADEHGAQQACNNRVGFFFSIIISLS